MNSSIEYWVRFISLYTNWIDLLINRLLKRPTKIIELNNGMIFIGNNKSNLSNVVDEIILLNQYTPPYLSINKGDIVVDIGSQVGVFSILAAKLGAEKVISYEPDPESFSLLNENLYRNRCYTVNSHRKAISDKRSRIKLYLTDSQIGKSINPSSSKLQKHITVSSIRLEDIFKYEKLEKIDFLKIDCAGGKEQIFSSVSSAIWKKIYNISLKYDDHLSQLDHYKLLEIFTENKYATRSLNLDNGLGYIYAWKI